MSGLTTGAKWAAAPALLALVLAGAAARAADAPPTIERALRKHAPDVLEYLRAQKCQNVGVLKFRAGYGTQALRDDLGALNRTLADRLEVALVLALKDDDEPCILSHASDAIAKAKDKTLSHLTAKGRAAFFEDRSLLIPRAWGEDGPALADAFVTGEAVVTPDLRTVYLRLQVFDRVHTDSLKTIGDWFTAAGDPRLLSEADVSYVRPKGVKDSEDDTPGAQLNNMLAFRVAGSAAGPLGPLTSSTSPAVAPPVVAPPAPTPPVLPPPVVAAAYTLPEQEKDWESVLSKSPLKVEIRYNKIPVKVTAGSIETPSPNDKVSFYLENTDSDATYGVVLMINGESSIEHQTLAPLDCHKWVLAPHDKITVTGFQIDNNKDEEFKVLSPEASRGQEVNYGDNAGVFRVIAFRAATKDEAALALKDDNHNKDVRAISRGSLDCKGFDKRPPARLKTLQDKLLAEADPAKSSHEGEKGLVVAGETGDSNTKQVDFTAYPTADLSLVVHYYQPGK